MERSRRIAVERPEVSFVVPACDEAESLPVLAREIREAMEGAGIPYELLVVDDGSTDGTADVLAQLAGGDPRLRPLRLRRHGGQSAALAAGFRRARGGIVVTMDADLQNDPADVPRLLAELQGCDVVCGIRSGRRDPWIRRISSRIANRVRSRATGDGIVDVGCSLKAFRAAYLGRVPMFSGMHRFLPALLLMEGALIRQVPVRHRPRLHGRSKYGIGDRLWTSLADLLAVLWMRRRWIDRRLEEEVRP